MATGLPNLVRKRRNCAPRYVSLCFKLVAAVFKAVVSRLLVGNRPLPMIYRSVFESRLSQIGLAQNWSETGTLDIGNRNKSSYSHRAVCLRSKRSAVRIGPGVPPLSARKFLKTQILAELIKKSSDPLSLAELGQFGQSSMWLSNTRKAIAEIDYAFSGTE